MFVGSGHAHDKVTGQSISRLIMIVGRSPVFYYIKRQGEVEISNYFEEFMSMRHAVVEVVALWYLLIFFGVNVDTASEAYRDNLGGIQNATIKDSLLKKKHIAISYYKVHEAVAAIIIVTMKILSVGNFADCLTKSLPIADHNRFINGIFYGWLALGIRGSPCAFRLGVTFGVACTNLIEWYDTEMVSDQN